MKVLNLCIIVLFLYGCAAEQVVYVDRIVHVPEIVMEQCPTPPTVLPLETTPLDRLHLESSFNDVAKAYVKTVEIQEIKIEQYKEALDAVTDESE
jgi:hypothetical protein